MPELPEDEDNREKKHLYKHQTAKSAANMQRGVLGAHSDRC